ncbi:MAG: Fur family transcriptional regulator [Verrucomicrobia bacterium]|nr:MAG: Fur family transcriptional regulator [Verrucomicrobiota bacterium]
MLPEIGSRVSTVHRKNNIKKNPQSSERDTLKSSERFSSSYEKAMSHSGLRSTPQRRHIYDALMGRRDHPSATEVFLRVKKNAPSISLATVYNSLEALVACGLVRAVHVDREPTRYCANLQEHGHFLCDKCGKVHDVNWPAPPQSSLPPGYIIHSQEMTLRGLCNKCASSSQFSKEIQKL